MSVYGPIVTGKMVRDAVEETLRIWTPAYLGEVAAQAGLVRPGFQSTPSRCVLPRFKYFTSGRDPLDKKPEDWPPACMIVSTGTLGEPIKHSGGKWKVRWSIGVASFVSANDEDATNDLSEYYAAAVRAALLQHPSLGGFAEGVWWLGEEYDNDVSVDATRTLTFSMVNVGVDVLTALDSSAGLSEPPEDSCADPADGPIVLTTDAQL